MTTRTLAQIMVRVAKQLVALLEQELSKPEETQKT